MREPHSRQLLVPKESASGCFDSWLRVLWRPQDPWDTGCSVPSSSPPRRPLRSCWASCPGEVPRPGLPNCKELQEGGTGASEGAPAPGTTQRQKASRKRPFYSVTQISRFVFKKVFARRAGGRSPGEELRSAPGRRADSLAKGHLAGSSPRPLHMGALPGAPLCWAHWQGHEADHSPPEACRLGSTRSWEGTFVLGEGGGETGSGGFQAPLTARVPASDWARAGCEPLRPGLWGSGLPAGRTASP